MSANPSAAGLELVDAQPMDRDAEPQAKLRHELGGPCERRARVEIIPLQWDDLYSRAALARSAELVAKLCLRFCIPIHWLSVDELKAGGRGICGHVDCKIGRASCRERV